MTEKELSLTNEYNLEIDGYTGKLVTLGKIFNSQEFEDLYHREAYPGLGTVKKLSIMHHLELIGRYLDKE